MELRRKAVEAYDRTIERIDRRETRDETRDTRHETRGTRDERKTRRKLDEILASAQHFAIRCNREIFSSSAISCESDDGSIIRERYPSFKSQFSCKEKLLRFIFFFVLLLPFALEILQNKRENIC